ncbi:MAG: hypothetical protein WBA93_01465 [Microcoleaceae cyanobacterium]
MSAQSKFSWQERFQYKFDNFMSRGGFSVFLALVSAFFATFILLTSLRYFSESVFPNEDLESDLLWDVFVQLIGLRDTGDDANFATKTVGVLTIFIGLILFSSLVAFITQEFEARLTLLKKGKSIVVEKNHTLILGLNDRVVDIINELVLANESEEKATIVILSDEDKETMDDFLRDKLGDLKTTKIVTRNGSVTNLKNLNNVSVKFAKSVIILNNAKSSEPQERKTLCDTRVIKTILAILAANETETSSLPPIVAELHMEQYRTLAENLAPGTVVTLNSSDILAKILVQTSRNVGLATVYLNLVGFEGNEFYFYLPKMGWHNITFGELPFHFYQCIPIGVKHKDGTLTIKPSNDYKLDYQDEIIALAEDDSLIDFQSEFVVKPGIFKHPDCQKLQKAQIEKHLIIGWNSKTKVAIQEYAKYVIAGSEVNLVTQKSTPEIKAEFEKIHQNYPDVNMNVWEIDVESVEKLKTLKPYEYNSISILSMKGKSAEEIDAKTLTTLLEFCQIFRDYSNETGNQVTTELIAEIIDSEETDLVIKAGVQDFLLSNKFVSKILAQVSQEPKVMSVYKELFSEEGSEVYLKSAELYFSTKQLFRVTFADCVVAAQYRDEICIGVRISSEAKIKEKNFGIYFVPRLDRQFYLTSEDELITIAEDET